MQKILRALQLRAVVVALVVLGGGGDNLRLGPDPVGVVGVVVVATGVVIGAAHGATLIVVRSSAHHRVPDELRPAHATSRSRVTGRPARRSAAELRGLRGRGWHWGSRGGGGGGRPEPALGAASVVATPLQRGVGLAPGWRAHRPAAVPLVSPVQVLVAVRHQGGADDGGAGAGAGRSCGQVFVGVVARSRRLKSEL